LSNDSIRSTSCLTAGTNEGRLSDDAVRERCEADAKARQGPRETASCRPAPGGWLRSAQETQRSRAHWPLAAISRLPHRARLDSHLHAGCGIAETRAHRLAQRPVQEMTTTVETSRRRSCRLHNVSTTGVGSWEIRQDASEQRGGWKAPARALRTRRSAPSAS
jgi:hypothetical protein